MNEEKINMKHAITDLVAAYAVTLITIKKLDDNIKKTDELISQFKV